MNDLEKLIQNICLNGVERIRIGAFAKVQKTKNKGHISEEAYSITQRGLIPTNEFFGEKTKITSSDTSGYYLVYKNWFVYSPSRIDVGSINYLKVNEPVIVSPLDVVFSVDEEKILPVYLLTYLLSHYGMRQILDHRQGIEGTGRRTLPFAELAKVEIPLPPLPIQQRIVEILDKFTSLVSSLDSEIALRQKQYEYYRNKLLSFEEEEEGVEWKKSSEICEVSDYVANGSFADLRNNVTYKSEIDYALLVRTTDLAQDFKTDKIYIDKHAYAFLEKSRLFGGEIIINNIGAGVGKTFLCPERKERMCLGPNSIMVSTPNNRFYYYWFCSKFGQEAMMKVVSPGAMPKFNKTGFKTILLPIIPTEKMSKIVRTLDTFESLLTNLKKERELRQKQYEYYREKLLTFA